jgi:GntR family transcriptional regulator of vanillate catabolism
MKTQTRSVTDRLRDKLLEGEFLPGTHMQEIPLAAELGVSRTPVRAALAALEREGLLDYAPKRGFVVRHISAAEIADKFRVRAVLEGYAAAQCARLGLTAEALGLLASCVAEGDRILAPGRLSPADLPGYRRMNNLFHSTIIANADSPSTADYVRQISQIPFLSDRIILWDDFRLIARSHDDHHRVLDAIRERDATRAEALMREHVHYMGLTILAHLARTPAPHFSDTMTGT